MIRIFCTFKEPLCDVTMATKVISLRASSGLLARRLRMFTLSAFLCFQDTLRECQITEIHCLTYLPWVSPMYFVTFVLMAQFVLVNVVVAVLMKHLEESNKVQ